MRSARRRASRTVARLASVPDLDEELDRLYGLPPTAFTAARNDLARRLRAAGRTEAAAETAKRTKPSISAWAVNQLSRQRREDLQALVRLGRRLADAQLRAAAGEGKSEFEKLRSEHADAVRSLSASATEGLREVGGRPGDAVRRRIAETVRALSLDPAEPNPLLEGRLTADSPPTGFSLLERMDVPTRMQGRARAAPSGRRSAALREQLRAARTLAKEARGRASAASREAAKARREAERLEALAVGLRAEADQAAARIAALERELGDTVER
jgi:hypothetical protein